MKKLFALVNHVLHSYVRRVFRTGFPLTKPDKLGTLLPVSKLTISLIIPAHNEENYIAHCLDSCTRHYPETFQEIIVIDNASTDRTAEIASAYPGVRVVREDRKGLLFARQRGFKEAKGDLLAYVDADSQIPPHWTQMLLREFSADPDLICLSGPYAYRREEMTRVQHALTRFFWYGVAPVTASIVGFAVTGGNFVARREALQAIGGFDTSIAFYGEDTNLARRLHTVGKVKFSRSFHVFSSARRMRSDGFAKMGAIYALNYFSEAIFHRPMTKTYRDVR